MGKSNDAGRAQHGELLFEALGQDMAQVWSPTVENYLGRISKERSLFDRPDYANDVFEAVMARAGENELSEPKLPDATHSLKERAVPLCP